MTRDLKVEVAYDVDVQAWTAISPTESGFALQHRSLGALVDETRAMAADWFGEPATVDFAWPPKIARAVKKVAKVRSTADKANAVAADTVRSVANGVLGDLTDTDVAAVLGLSRQRIGQIRSAPEIAALSTSAVPSTTAPRRKSTTTSRVKRSKRT